MKELNYQVLSTGSKGNCVIIENVMVDCATSWTKMKEYLYDIDILLISHSHSDHFRPNIYKRIRQEFPNILVCANRSVWEFYNTEFDVMIKDYEPIDAFGLHIIPFPLIHGVENHGFIWDFDDHHILYATDTETMEFCPRDRKFTDFFLEANHDEKKLKHAFRHSKEYGYNAYNASKAHLSRQKAKEFYFCNRESKESLWVELHMSSRFY